MKDYTLIPLPAADNRATPIHIAVWCLYEGIVKDGYLFKNPDAGLGADLLKPWGDLYAYGQEHGFIFFTFDQVSDWNTIDAIILCDRPLDGNPLVDAAMQSNAVKYLITAECPIIYPGSWEQGYHRLFKRVWTWDDTLVDGTFYLKSNSVTDPSVACDFVQKKSDFAQRKLVTMIAGAKASQHPNELYSHRVHAIRWFEASAPEQFDLYGMGWDREHFPSYKGAVKDKLATLAKYRFCICYENAQGYPGYITEKILDCLRTGTVPIYGGAPNIERWIPAECFIAINRFKDFFELFDFLMGMDEATYTGYLERIEKFIVGTDFYPFSIACMVDGITRTLHWDLRQAEPSDASLLQNPNTLRMEVKTHPVPLFIWMPYDPNLKSHYKLRGLWQFFSSHFPEVTFYFVRHADELGPGEVRDNGNDLLVGRESDLDRAVRDVLLWRHPRYFVLLKTSIFNIFNPGALRLQCAKMGKGIKLYGPSVSLMGRDMLLQAKPQPDATSVMELTPCGIDDWPGNLLVDQLYSEDPEAILSHMRNILQDVATNSKV